MHDLQQPRKRRWTDACIFAKDTASKIFDAYVPIKFSREFLKIICKNILLINDKAFHVLSYFITLEKTNAIAFGR